MRAPQFFRISTGHRVEGRNPWHLRCVRLNQLRAGADFGARSVRSRRGPPVCSPPLLTRPERLSVLPAFLGFNFRAFRSPGRGRQLPEGIFHFSDLLDLTVTVLGAYSRPLSPSLERRLARFCLILAIFELIHPPLWQGSAIWTPIGRPRRDGALPDSNEY